MEIFIMHVFLFISNKGEPPNSTPAVSRTSQMFSHAVRCQGFAANCTHLKICGEAETVEMIQVFGATLDNLSCMSVFYM